MSRAPSWVYASILLLIVAHVCSGVSQQAAKAVVGQRAGNEIASSKKTAGPIDVFTGGLKSLAMLMAGNAEGNLNPNGTMNPNYEKHQDPGDFHTNMGICSESNARNGTSLASPEEADQYCLNKLKNAAIDIDAKAKQIGLKLSLLERLNAIDLYNQAPLGVMSNPGYLDRLLAARKKKFTGKPILRDEFGELPAIDKEEEAILYARTEAYSPDPESIAVEQRYYDTTFKNRYYVERDQRRRLIAIVRAARHFFESKGQVMPVSFNPNDEAEQVFRVLSKADRLYKSTN